MNVYDFDDTIYKGDSSKDFIVYTALHHPCVMARNLPNMMYAAVMLMLGKMSKKEMKERFFYFVTNIKDVELEVDRFWNKKQHKIKSWYLQEKKVDDVIISASPTFLLKEICKRLEISNLMATDLDTQTGKILGENCKGKEKVMRFYKCFPNESIDKFYSDSITDKYLAKEAKESFFVKGNVITKWEL